MARIVGIDLALRRTGVARLTVSPDGPPATYTDVVGIPPESRASLVQRWHRLDGTQAAMVEAVAPMRFEDGVKVGRAWPDLAVIEGPSYASGADRGSFDVAHLWWAVVGELIVAGVPVAVVAPSTLKVYATGDGGKATRKPQVVEAVRRHYGDLFDVTSHDVADAVVLAAMGARHLERPIDALPPTHLRAMSSAKWPTAREEHPLP